ncbi:MAG: hypothetical protein MI919_26450, partial [Holophagales bacterium]|nr:hypothetical protein [Holophagales bacterium]
AQIDLARRRGIPHVYLGYWVRENRSMCYKSAYRPHALLQGRPELGEEPDWAPARPSSSATEDPASRGGHP